MSAQENYSTLLVSAEGSNSSTKLKESLEKGDAATKVEALKEVITLQLNGEPQNSLIMTIIKHCVPSEDHTVKKLLIFFWESVDKTDPTTGKLLSEMILVCNFIRNDLQHPNEYIRGVTLKFLTKLREKEILEPVVSAVLENLTHRVAYVRRSAVLAVHSIFSKFPQLIPDAPETIEKFLDAEDDISARRNAFVMLFHCAQDRCIRFLSSFRDNYESSASSEIFEMCVVDLIKQLMSNNPYERSKYVPVIFTLLQSRSPAVQYQCASTLQALASSPTAIRHAVNAFVDLLTTHSDNNVKLIVLDRLVEIKERFPEVMQDSQSDVLRGLASTNKDIRVRVLDLALSLVTVKNVESFVQHLKKELVRAQGDDDEDGTTQDYQQRVVKTIHSAVMRHTFVAPAVVPIMMDHISESGASAYDVIVFIREVMLSQPQLRDELLERLVNQFQSLTSAAVIRACLWIFGVHSRSVEEVTNVFETLKESMEPFPLVPIVEEENRKNVEESAVMSAVTTVGADGSYVMSIQVADKKTAVERTGLTGPRAHICAGDFLVAAALCNTMSKLVVRMFEFKNMSSATRNTLQSDALAIMHEIVRYGLSKDSPVTMDDDPHERIRLSMTIARNPCFDAVRHIIDDSIAAYENLQKSKAKHDEDAVATQQMVTHVDQPVMFTQLLKHKSRSVVDIGVSDGDVIAATTNASLERSEDFFSKLNRVKQLTGFCDPIYAEASVTIHQFDILVEILLVNQTDQTLQNVSVELATVGDLKICERPQTFTLAPRSTVQTRSNIKVSSTEHGVIFGNIVFDSNSSDRSCVILNEIHMDIMDYIKPGECNANDFRRMWLEFDWENKVVLSTQIADLHECVEYVMKRSNMKPITEDWKEERDTICMSVNLYAKSVFGEDALMNLSIEKTEEDKIEGFIRVRSRTQGIALGLGDRF